MSSRFSASAVTPSSMETARNTRIVPYSICEPPQDLDARVYLILTVFVKNARCLVPLPSSPELRSQEAERYLGRETQKKPCAEGPRGDKRPWSEVQGPAAFAIGEALGSRRGFR